MNAIQIDPEFKALIPPLRADERAQLEANIQAEGVRDPLVVWAKDDILLDGHNRYEIATRLGLPFDVRRLSFDNRDAAIEWMYQHQLGRRNLTDDQRATVAYQLQQQRSKIERQRRSEAANERRWAENPASLSDAASGKDQLPSPSPVDTRAAVAKEFKVSERKLKQVRTVATQAPEVLTDVQQGRTTLAEAVRDIKRIGWMAKVAAQSATSPSGPPAIACQDALTWINGLESGSVDLLLTDPPYSTDVDDIEQFAAAWLPNALTKLKATGRAYVCVGAYPQELAAYCRAAMPAQILVWTYRNTLGPAPSHLYKLNWQAVLYYHGVDAPALDCPQMTEQFSVQDIAAPDGRIGDRLHAWQKPLMLGERFVRHGSQLGDLVIDPFAGTGTFLLAASQLGRRAIGCERDDAMLEIAVSRGCVRE
jgi:16S rRNA G966 N2-methylase RsmD